MFKTTYINSCLLGVLMLTAATPVLAQVSPSDTHYTYSKDLLQKEPSSPNPTTQATTHPTVFVNRGPTVAASKLMALPLIDLPKHGSAYTSLDVEIRFGKERLKVWSKIVALENSAAADEYFVLDAVAIPNGVAIALAMPNSTIGLLEVQFGGSARFVSLPPVDWSLLAAAVPTKMGRLAVKLSYSEQDAQLKAEVTDTVGTTRQSRDFIQAKGKWEFIPGDRRREKLPTTAPSTLPSHGS